MPAENPIAIDLNEIHAAFGYVPHPEAFRNFLANRNTLARVVNEQADTSIGALDIEAVNIGYENDDCEIVSTADDANITDDSFYWVWIKDDEDDEEDVGECVICGEAVYGGGVIHEDLCDDCSEV